MERVTVEDVHTRLDELIARVEQGEVIIIETGDQKQLQLVRLPIQYLIEAYGIPAMLGGTPNIGAQEGDIYRPYVTTEEELERARKARGPIQPGSAAGQIWMSDDFDEPLEDFKDYME